MDIANPYSAPQAELLSEAVVPASEAAVPSSIVGDLTSARRWMMLFAGAGFLATALVLVASPVLLGLGGGAVAFAVFGLLYMATAAQLMRTSSAIGKLGREPSAERLSGVTAGLAGFWRLASVVTAIAVGLVMFGSILVRIFLSAA